VDQPARSGTTSVFHLLRPIFLRLLVQELPASGGAPPWRALPVNVVLPPPSIRGFPQFRCRLVDWKVAEAHPSADRMSFPPPPSVTGILDRLWVASSVKLGWLVPVGPRCSPATSFRRLHHRPSPGSPAPAEGSVLGGSPSTSRLSSSLPQKPKRIHWFWKIGFPPPPAQSRNSRHWRQGSLAMSAFRWRHTILCGAAWQPASVRRTVRAWADMYRSRRPSKNYP